MTFFTHLHINYCDGPSEAPGWMTGAGAPSALPFARHCACTDVPSLRKGSPERSPSDSVSSIIPYPPVLSYPTSPLHQGSPPPAPSSAVLQSRPKAELFRPFYPGVTFVQVPSHGLSPPALKAIPSCFGL